MLIRSTVLVTITLEKLLGTLTRSSTNNITVVIESSNLPIQTEADFYQAHLSTKY